MPESTDIIGLITAVTDLLPPAGAAREPKRQISITDVQYIYIFTTAPIMCILDILSCHAIILQCLQANCNCYTLRQVHAVI